MKLTKSSCITWAVGVVLLIGQDLDAKSSRAVRYVEFTSCSLASLREVDGEYVTGVGDWASSLSSRGREIVRDQRIDMLIVNEEGMWTYRQHQNPYTWYNTPSTGEDFLLLQRVRDSEDFLRALGRCLGRPVGLDAISSEIASCEAPEESLVVFRSIGGGDE
jgi:hypothetical protein